MFLTPRLVRSTATNDPRQPFVTSLGTIVVALNLWVQGDLSQAAAFHLETLEARRRVLGAARCAHDEEVAAARKRAEEKALALREAREAAEASGADSWRRRRIRTCACRR